MIIRAQPPQEHSGYQKAIDALAAFDLEAAERVYSSMPEMLAETLMVREAIDIVLRINVCLETNDYKGAMACSRELYIGNLGQLYRTKITMCMRGTIEKSPEGSTSSNGAPLDELQKLLKKGVLEEKIVFSRKVNVHLWKSMAGHKHKKHLILPEVQTPAIIYTSCALPFVRRYAGDQAIESIGRGHVAVLLALADSETKGLSMKKIAARTGLRQDYIKVSLTQLRTMPDVPFDLRREKNDAANVSDLKNFVRECVVWQ